MTTILPVAQRGEAILNLIATQSLTLSFQVTGFKRCLMQCKQLC